MTDALINITEEHRKLLISKIESIFENDPLVRKAKLKKIFNEDGIRLID
jgi:hypothetical protein